MFLFELTRKLEQKKGRRVGILVAFSFCRCWQNKRLRRPSSTGAFI